MSCISIENSRATPFLSVAICTRNRAGALGMAVESVLRQLRSETDLLIVDNDSTDETAERVREWALRDPRVTYWREPRRGVASARNAALAQARGLYILFFDDDEVAEPGWLDAYLSFLRAPPSLKVACVGGPYIPQYESPLPPWMDPEYGRFDIGAERRRLTGKTTLAGGNCAYVRELALRIGGFDEELTRREDSDLNLRLRDAGYETWWLPEARVRHFFAADRLRTGPQVRLHFAEGRSAMKFRLKTARDAGKRAGLWAGRGLTAPVQAVAQLLSLAGLLAIGERRRAFNLGLRLCRTLGMAWESLLSTRRIFCHLPPRQKEEPRV